MWRHSSFCHAVTSAAMLLRASQIGDAERTPARLVQANALNICRHREPLQTGLGRRVVGLAAIAR